MDWLKPIEERIGIVEFFGVGGEEDVVAVMLAADCRKLMAAVRVGKRCLRDVAPQLDRAAFTARLHNQRSRSSHFRPTQSEKDWKKFSMLAKRCRNALARLRSGNVGGK